MSNFTTSLKNCMSVIKTALSKKADKDYVSVVNGNIKIGSDTILVGSKVSQTYDGYIRIQDANGTNITQIDLRSLNGLHFVKYSLNEHNITTSGKTHTFDQSLSGSDLIWINSNNSFTLNLSTITTTAPRVVTVIVSNTSSGDINIPVTPSGTLHLVGVDSITVAAGKVSIITAVVANSSTIVSSVSES